MHVPYAAYAIFNTLHVDANSRARLEYLHRIDLTRTIFSSFLFAFFSFWEGKEMRRANFTYDIPLLNHQASTICSG